MNDRLREEREEELKPLLLKLFGLYPPNKVGAAEATAEIVVCAEKYAITSTHFLWKDLLSSYMEKYPENVGAIVHLYEFIAEHATIECAIQGVSQEELDESDIRIKRLLGLD